MGSHQRLSSRPTPHGTQLHGSSSNGRFRVQVNRQSASLSFDTGSSPLLRPPHLYCTSSIRDPSPPRAPLRVRPQSTQAAALHIRLPRRPATASFGAIRRSNPVPFSASSLSLLQQNTSTANDQVAVFEEGPEPEWLLRATVAAGAPGTSPTHSFTLSGSNSVPVLPCKSSIHPSSSSPLADISSSPNAAGSPKASFASPARCDADSLGSGRSVDLTMDLRLELARSLRHTSFFGGWLPSELRELVGSLPSRRLRRYEVLFREGQPASAFFICVHGQMEIKSGKHSKLVGAGDCFGTEALCGLGERADEENEAFEGGATNVPRSSTCMALCASILLVCGSSGSRWARVLEQRGSIKLAEATEIAEHLSRAPIFSDLPRRTLSSLVPAAKLKMVAEGVKMAEEGRRSAFTALLLHGHTMSTQSGSRAPKHTTEMSSFPFLCEDCILSQAPALEWGGEPTALIASDWTVVTVERSYLLCFPRELGPILLQRFPSLAKMIRERLNMIQGSLDLHAAEVKSNATQKKAVKSAIGGSSNELDIPADTFQRSCMPHYYTTSRRSSRPLPLPHVHLGLVANENIAKRAAITLAWGVEVGRIAARMGLSRLPVDAFGGFASDAEPTSSIDPTPTLACGEGQVHDRAARAKGGL